MKNTIKSIIIENFNTIENYINKNINISNNNTLDLLYNSYYNIYLLKDNDLLNELSKEELQSIINIFLILANKNTNIIKNIVNTLRNELKTRPNDNYDNMTKEELITLLRNKS